MNLYVISVNRPPFRVETYYTLLAVGGSCPPTVSCFVPNHLGNYHSTTLPADSKLRRVSGHDHPHFKKLYPDAVELTPIEFSCRFGLNY